MENNGIHKKIYIMQSNGGIMTEGVGLLVADMRHDFSLTRIERLDYVDIEFMESIWEGLEREAIKTLKEEDILLNRSIDMRYQGQSFEINVKASKDGLEKDFKEEHIPYLL